MVSSPAATTSMPSRMWLRQRFRLRTLHGRRRRMPDPLRRCRKDHRSTRRHSREHGRPPQHCTCLRLMSSRAGLRLPLLYRCQRSEKERRGDGVPSARTCRVAFRRHDRRQLRLRGRSRPNFRARRRHTPRALKSRRGPRRRHRLRRGCMRLRRCRADQPLGRHRLSPSRAECRLPSLTEPWITRETRTRQCATRRRLSTTSSRGECVRRGSSSRERRWCKAAVADWTRDARQRLRKSG